MFGSYLDVGERQIAFLVANVLNLIESRNGVANMRRIRHRFFARTRECEGGFGQMIDLRSIELAGCGAFQVAFAPLSFLTSD